MTEACENEFSPMLSLIDPRNGWIKATYVNGEVRDVDLRTALKESAKIRSLTLLNPAATAYLYKILLSITYALLDEDDDFADTDFDEWNEARARAIVDNIGFNADDVDDYFEKWKERFYLIHPRFPFLQDPYIARFLDEKNTLDSIAQIVPGATLKKSESKPTWMLPADDVITMGMSDSAKTAILMSALLYQRSSHGPVNKGSRSWENAPTSKAYPTINPIRRAIHFLVEGNSLYQTLMISATFNDGVDDPRDVPEWEWDVNELGYLGLVGFNHPYTDRFAPDGHRSTVNASQLAVLFVVDDDGNIKQTRKIACEYKAPEGQKKILPQAWEPFTSSYVSDGSIFGVSDITPESVMTTPNLFSSVFATSSKNPVKQPEVIAQFMNVDADDEPLIPSLQLRGRPLTVRALITSESMSQDNKFSSMFELEFPDMDLVGVVNDLQSRARIKKWVEAFNTIRWALTSSIKGAVTDGDEGSKMDLKSIPIPNYDSTMNSLFRSALSADGVEHISAFKDRINDVVMREYEEKAKPFQSAHPLAYAQGLKNLTWRTREELKKE